MKLKKVTRLLAISISAAMITPTGVFAAESQSGSGSVVVENQLSEESLEETEPIQEETPENPEQPVEETQENPQQPGEETPENPQQPGEETPENPQQPVEETPENPQQPGEETPENPQQPVEETPENPQQPGEETPENPEQPGEENPEENPEGQQSEYSSNEELVAAQQIISVPQIIEDFRFWTVAKKFAFAKNDLLIREEMSQEARNTGLLKKDGVCYILKEEENGWLFVESGTVRGFVKAEEVLSGGAADAVVDNKINEAKEKAKREKTKYQGIDSVLMTAEELIPYNQNAAFLHTRSTVRNVLADKVFALCTGDMVNIREGKGTDTRVVGTMNKETLCYVLADKDQDWIYIESGDVRGFVKHDYLNMGEPVTQSVTQTGEGQFAKAEEKVDIKENQACYYTITSIKSGVPQGELRQSMVEFASQFIGNPYVWGGTSLTEGADCSGFVQSIYAQYGYSLPRIAEDQAQCGVKIPVEEAQPGDLIFYARDGYIFHVVMYAGEGQTIEAKGTNYGIVRDDVNTGCAVWASRILEDNTYTTGGSIGEVNVTPEQYGECLGTFKITHYCPGSCCCDEYANGITATGVQAVEGDTIAVDPTVIPYGTKVIINGHIFTASDCGGAIKNNRIDIFVNSHEYADALGVYYSDVYLLK